MFCKLTASCAAIGLSVFGLTAPASAATPEQVDAAIKKGTEFLLAVKNAAGNWENVPQPLANGGAADPNGKQWGGLTAIVTYALLAADTSPTAPELAKPVEFLKNANITGIYAAGLRCQVWYLLDDKKLQLFLARDANTLLNAIHTNGPADHIGFYPYYYDKAQPQDWYDRSVSQYGVLGAWALDEAEFEIPLRYWALVDQAWRRAQLPDGGWNYSAGAPPGSTATMTAAGIATLFITQDYALGNTAECKGNIANANIDAGLAWMDRHIKAALGGNYYGMYGIERIGVASGRKYFDVIDWYHDGADFIVKSQNADGSWGGDLPNTCFALLFLVRGRAPIVMNKLEYSTLEKNGKVEPGPWNERPRDCANFAHWMGRNFEQHNLNWQIVNLKVAPEELHDSPILYISGNRDITLSQAEIAKLRTFVEQGGMILGNADCGNALFTKSFKELGAKMFPDYPFRELSASHLIFDEQFSSSKWRAKPKIFAQTNGVRELTMLIPEADLSRAWQGRNDKTRADLFQLGANIFLYSVDKKNLQVKGETYIVKEDPAIQATRSITLGRLNVGENWNPEPAGWPRLAAILHNDQKVAVTVKDVTCDTASLKGVKVLHFTGTTSFRLTDEQRKTLKEFVEGGGTLIVDAAGGSAELAAAAEGEIKMIFGQAPDTLPMTSPVYNLPDLKIDSVAYRNFCHKILTGSLRIARIKGLAVKARLAVFYSREDLSAGIVGEPVDGVTGYEPASATALMRNLVLFGAFGFPKPPATGPTTNPTTMPATQPTTVLTTTPTTVPTAAPAANSTTQPIAPAVPPPAK